MPTLNEVKTLNSSWIKGQPLVAVFFGGTGGIGQATIRELVKAHAAAAAAPADGGKGLRIYIVARGAKTAEEVLDECRATCPGGEYKFIKAENLSLLRDIDRVCAEIKQAEEQEEDGGRIDYLMLGQGGSILNPRIDTEEGLDQTMSLMYYSRMRAILNLMPLLEKSSLPASVISVYAAGLEAKLFEDDLSLREPGRYSYLQSRSHVLYMKTHFFESLARQHGSRLRLVHVLPGLVDGPIFHGDEVPRWFRLLAGVLMPTIGRWFLCTPPAECGQRMLSYASARYPAAGGNGKKETTPPGGVSDGTDEKPGSGAYAVGATGQNVFKPEAYAKLDREAFGKKVWDHTTKALSVIEAGGKFTE